MGPSGHARWCFWQQSSGVVVATVKPLVRELSAEMRASENTATPSEHRGQLSWGRRSSIDGVSSQDESTQEVSSSQQHFRESSPLLEVAEDSEDVRQAGKSAVLGPTENGEEETRERTLFLMMTMMMIWSTSVNDNHPEPKDILEGTGIFSEEEQCVEDGNFETSSSRPLAPSQIGDISSHALLDQVLLMFLL